MGDNDFPAVMANGGRDEARDKAESGRHIEVDLLHIVNLEQIFLLEVCLVKENLLTDLNKHLMATKNLV